MKRIILLTISLLLSAYCIAQQQLAFPFQGGNLAMAQFFKDNITISPEIINSKANGTVIFKFTADEKGTVKKLVIYYADDVILAHPLIQALKKSNHKWIVPNNEKIHDYIVAFSVNFIPPATDTLSPQKEFYNFYQKRKQILSSNQIPLDNTTLLPTIVVNYNLSQ